MHERFWGHDTNLWGSRDVTSSVGTQEIRFGRKTDEIWTKNGQLIGVIAVKVVKFFHIHWHYHNAFTVGLKERMPRIIGMRID